MYWYWYIGFCNYSTDSAGISYVYLCKYVFCVRFLLLSFEYSTKMLKIKIQVASRVYTRNHKTIARLGKNIEKDADT